MISKPNLTFIALCLFITTIFTVMLFKTRESIYREVGPTTTQEAVSYLKELNIKKEELHKEKESLELRKRQLSAAYVEKGEFIDLVNNEINKLEGYLGYKRVSGLGIKIVLESPEGYIVSVETILDLINDLWSSGAVAITINEKRVTWETYFELTEEDLLMNEMEINQPYLIEVIGPEDVIRGTMYMPGGFVEKMQLRGINVEITKNVPLDLPSRGD